MHCKLGDVLLCFQISRLADEIVRIILEGEGIGFPTKLSLGLVN